jgi:hypothetical protein
MAPHNGWTSSPISNYSSNSPAYSGMLSLVDDVEYHSESEYEAIAARTAWQPSSIDKWPGTDSEGPLASWVAPGIAQQRKASIVSISPRGSPSRAAAARRSSKIALTPGGQRRGSATSLRNELSSSPGGQGRRFSHQSHHMLQLATRRPSAMSVTSLMSEVSFAGTEAAEEIAQIDKIRSMEELDRRFSEVVEIAPQSPDSSSSESEEDRDFTPSITGGRRGAINIWSPDTEDMTDDESDLQSLPPVPTPVIDASAPSVLSNFPLASIAVESVPQASPTSILGLDRLHGSHRMAVETPSPEMQPAEFLRRLREPISLRGWQPASEPAAFVPAATYKRSQSSPLFAAGSMSNELFRARTQRKNMRSTSITLPEIAHSPRDTSGKAEERAVEPAAARPAMAEEIPTEQKRPSFAAGAEEFDFLASEISMGTPRQLSPVLATPRAFARSAISPGISSPPLMSLPVRFDAMAAFLGRSEGAFSAPVSPSQDAGATPTISSALPNTARDFSSRPISLQHLPHVPLASQELRNRPRSGGLAIQNADLPENLSSTSLWATEWSDGARFPTAFKPARPTLHGRSVTLPVITTNSVGDHRIARKAVPVYSPDHRCTGSRHGSPSMVDDVAMIPPSSVCTGSSGGSGEFATPRPEETQDERDRRRQRRAERRKCRRCEEKRALRILAESIKLGRGSGSPSSSPSDHSHRKHRHQSFQYPPRTSAFESPISSPVDERIVDLAPPTRPAGPVRFTSYQQPPSILLPAVPSHVRGISAAPRPALLPRGYSDRDTLPPQYRVTQTPAFPQPRRPTQMSAKEGPSISGPTLTASTSGNVEVQRALAAAALSARSSQPTRPVLQRSASSSHSRSKSKSAFARIFQAFDHHHADAKFKGETETADDGRIHGSSSRRVSMDGAIKAEAKRYFRKSNVYL